LLYRGNTLERGIVGYKETIKNVSRKDFVVYMKKHYIAKETVVCVAGKFDEKKVNFVVLPFHFLCTIRQHIDKYRVYCQSKNNYCRGRSQ